MAKKTDYSKCKDMCFVVRTDLYSYNKKTKKKGKKLRETKQYGLGFNGILKLLHFSQRVGIYVEDAIKTEIRKKKIKLKPIKIVLVI